MGPEEPEPRVELRAYCREYFARLCRGYALSLDDTGIRAWLPGHKNLFDRRGSWTGPARTFPALAAWLSDPSRPTRFEVRGRAIDLEALTLRILDSAFDRGRNGWWGPDLVIDHRPVESSVVAYGAWLLRDTLLRQVPASSLRHLQRWLEEAVSGPLPANNWALFWITNHSARKALGWSFDQSVIDAGWERIEALERSDGWMTDGEEGFFDDYNWWAFGSLEMFSMQMDEGGGAERRARVGSRIERRLHVFPYFFGKDGSYADYGRSLTYKFARLACPVLAYGLGLWPHPAGMLGRLVRLHLAFYDHVGAIDRSSDVVVQTLSEFGNPDVRERYVDTGHPYWCMLAFAALWQLPDGDALWSTPEEALPVEAGDFRRAVRSAGWILTGTKAAGQVQRHCLGSRHGDAPYAAKYGKFLYGTHFPVNLGSVDGDFGPDSALCITDGDHWAHPGAFDGFAATEEYLRGIYRLRLGALEVLCETILVPDGESCLRTHRIRVPRLARGLRLLEGGAALGYPPGLTPTKVVDQSVPLSLVLLDTPELGSRISLIRGLSGYRRALPASGFRGHDRLNAIHYRAVTPVLEVPDIRARWRDHTLVLSCFTLALARPVPAPLPKPEVAVDWQKDGTVLIAFDGRELSIPPL